MLAPSRCLASGKRLTGRIAAVRMPIAAYPRTAMGALVAAALVFAALGGTASATVLAPPSIEGESVSGQAPNPITLEARIDPKGQAVRYQFQLVADPGEYASEID